MPQSDRCERIEELLPLYIDGDLTGEEKASVEAHISGCGSCERSLQAFRALESRLEEMPALMPDAGTVSAAVTAALGLGRRRSLAPVLNRLSMVWSFAVATAALILLVGRFDFVSAVMDGQRSFVDAAGRTMDYWINGSSGLIASLISRFDALVSSDPWILAAAMTGFGMLIFSAGMVAAIRTLR